jgi:hypothetical protein
MWACALRSQFRNNLCKDDSALFSGFLRAHGEQVDVHVSSTVLCKNRRKPPHGKHVECRCTVYSPMHGSRRGAQQEEGTLHTRNRYYKVDPDLWHCLFKLFVMTFCLVLEDHLFQLLGVHPHPLVHLHLSAKCNKHY